MKAVILAAGEGRRLRPFTETMPKVMLPIANKPILEYVFDAIKKAGINEIVVVVGYKKEIIMEYFKDYEGLKISYVFQDKQLGTAHALLQARNHIKETFLVLSGDNIIDEESLSNIIQDRDFRNMLYLASAGLKYYSMANHKDKMVILFLNILEKGRLKFNLEKEISQIIKSFETFRNKYPYFNSK